MAQKVLAGRCGDPSLSGGMIEVKVDQAVLSRAPLRAFAEALGAGLKRASPEVSIAYDVACVTLRDEEPEALGPASPSPPELLAHGIAIARAGVGYPSAVHLERFASPARLCVTDEPRLAGMGGIGMLSLVVPPGLLGQALAQGSVWLRPPRSVQVHLTGRVRPFICARDIALELGRRGLGEAVRRVEVMHAAPVVLEFAGPSARLLSVAERAVLAAIAPQLGAAAALFVSDERTEVFLRDQRRSKAYRALAPDAGAPCDEVVNVDLSAVDPLLMDESGQVRAVRDLAGKPVAQAILGGDGGVTLRDLLAAATFLKSKRVPPRTDLLLAVPSRQMLEVLASTGALADLIATGARLIEPDARIASGALYPPPPGSSGMVSVRTCDPEPRTGASAPAVVASAETIAYSVANGEVGDPRAFRRPVRVTVPRALPTDDVLVVRERRAEGAKKSVPLPLPATPPAPVPWRGAQTLEVIDDASLPHLNGASKKGGERPLSPDTPPPVAVLCATLDEVRQLAARAPDVAPSVRAVLAPFIPSGLVAVFSGVGIAAIRVDAASARGLKGQKTLALPAPSQWPEGQAAMPLGPAKVPLTWLALGVERSWASAGTARPARR
jgi:aconitate hydratase